MKKKPAPKTIEKKDNAIKKSPYSQPPTKPKISPVKPTVKPSSGGLADYYSVYKLYVAQRLKPLRKGEMAGFIGPTSIVTLHHKVQTICWITSTIYAVASSTALLIYQVGRTDHLKSIPFKNALQLYSFTNKDLIFVMHGTEECIVFNWDSSNELYKGRASCVRTVGDRYAILMLTVIPSSSLVKTI
jgi:hypothetical protein